MTEIYVDDPTARHMDAIRRSNENPAKLVARLVRAERARLRPSKGSTLTDPQRDAIDALRRGFIAEHGDPLFSCSGGGGLAPSDSAPSRRFGAKGDRARQ